MPSVTGLGALLLIAFACCVGILAQQPDTPTTSPTTSPTVIRNATCNIPRPAAPTPLPAASIPCPAAPIPCPAAPPSRPAVSTTSARRGGASSAGPGGHVTSSESSDEIQRAASSESSEEIQQAASSESSEEIQQAAPTKPAPVTPRPALRAAATGSMVLEGPRALRGPNIGVGLTNNADAGNHLPRKGSQLPSSQGVGASSSASGVGVAVAVVAAIVVGSVIFVIKKYRHNSPALVEV